MDNLKQRKIVVLGGGTAGWLTALFCKQTFPSASVTVIENKIIGTIGVGEGTTLIFSRFLNDLGLDEFEAMREAGGSIKSGISFENWNGDNKKYFHSFRAPDIFSIPPHFDSGCEKYFLQTLIKDGLDFNEHVYTSRLAYRKELDLYNLQIALHIDNYKLGEYLKNTAQQRGIAYVDGNFSHVEVDEHNFIQKICLDDGRGFECDFIFDCSGFAKLIIGAHFKTKWSGYSDFLPVNKAVVFKQPVEKDVKPYTQSIAMKYGWMWKIPVQDRIGAGYVFDSNYVSEEDALQEAQQLLREPIEDARLISFDSGSHEQFWVKNCIAVGLGSNFIEPLEATCLDLVIIQLNQLKNFHHHVFKYNEKSVNMYNSIITTGVEGVAHFIYLHYLTKRSDTEFWSKFQEHHPVPKKFEEILQSIYDNTLTEREVGSSPYHILDFLEIANGLDMFKQPIEMEGYENLRPSVSEYKQQNDERFRNPAAVDIIKCSDFLEGFYGPERLGSPYGPVCECGSLGFHRTGMV